MNIRITPSGCIVAVMVTAAASLAFRWAMIYTKFGYYAAMLMYWMIYGGN